MIFYEYYNTKRWAKRYDGTWESLKDKSRRPNSHPKQHTRSLGGLFHALRRLGLIQPTKKKGRRNYRQCTVCEIPGEKVQIDVKVLPHYCHRGKLHRDEKQLYQWTAIYECTRVRYLYIFEEHTPENSLKFLAKFLQRFPFEVMTV